MKVFWARKLDWRYALTIRSPIRQISLGISLVALFRGHLGLSHLVGIAVISVIVTELAGQPGDVGGDAVTNILRGGGLLSQS